LKNILIGTAKSEPGKVTCGFLDGLELPTGTVDRIPVIIAQGTKDGPTFFLSANIHGNELTGIAVIHDVLTEDLVKELKGTVVAFPTVNPSALRRGNRTSEYGEDDPNRTFPEGRFARKEEADEDTKYLKPYEQIASKLYDSVKEYGDYHLDFHNHTLHSLPYSIIDRVFYDTEKDKASAVELSKKQKEMVEAFGAVNMSDFASEKYMNLKYHRTFSGAVLNSLHIPAFTVELGGNSVVQEDIVAGSAKGTRNVLRWAGMLDSPSEEITEWKVPKYSGRIRRFEHPRSPYSGLIRFLVEPGDQIAKGQPIARIVDIHGRPLGDGYIRTDYDGYVIVLRSHITVYRDDSIAEIGIADDTPLVEKNPRTQN
jgi:predicted deacylase